MLLLTIAALVSLALIALAVWDGSRRDEAATVPARPPGEPQGSDEASAPRAGERPVYPYSVIEGGAASADELKGAMAADPVVADHFKHFDLSKTRVETLTEPKVAHVSYRKGNDIFWTRKPVTIPAGERVLTDGVNFARTRCGNCLSTAPAAPVSDDEPPARVLDTPGLTLRQVSLAPPAGTLQLPPGTGGPTGSAVSTPPGGGSPRGTDPGSAPRGGIGLPGPAGPGGSVSIPPGREAPGDEVLPVPREGAENPGSNGQTGLPGPHGPAAPGSGSTGPNTAQGPSGNPPVTPGTNPNNPPGPMFEPPLNFTPPANGSNPPGNSINLPGNPFDPMGPPFDPPGPPFDPPGNPFEPQENPFDPPGPPGGPFDPSTYENTPTNGPGGPGGPSNPGGPVDSVRQTETIPEPGTTALMLIGFGLAASRRRGTRRPGASAGESVSAGAVEVIWPPVDNRSREREFPRP